MNGVFMDVGINVISDLIGVPIALALSLALWRQIEQWRFGGWHVVVRQGNNEVARRPISIRKLKQVLEEPADLSVFVKGVVSPYAWLKADILANEELFYISHNVREMVVDLDHNPQ